MTESRTIEALMAYQDSLRQWCAIIEYACDEHQEYKTWLSQAVREEELDTTTSRASCHCQRPIVVDVLSPDERVGDFNEALGIQAASGLWRK